MDPVYLVVGGGNGLGVVTEKELAHEGANIDPVISDPGIAVEGSGSDPGPAREVAAEIGSEIDGGSAVVHFDDTADADDAIDKAFDSIADGYELTQTDRFL